MKKYFRINIKLLKRAIIIRDIFIDSYAFKKYIV